MITTLNSQYIFEIPLHWTAEQADAVFEILNLLADAIFQAYEKEIIQTTEDDLAIEIHQPTNVNAGINDDDGDNYIPF